MKKILLTTFLLMPLYSFATLSCAGGNIEITYKEGFWPFTHDKATFKDRGRKLDLSSEFSVSSYAYNIENENWLTDDDIVFQLSGTKDGQPTYEPYILLLNSREMKRTRSGGKVRIGFSSSIPEKIREYICLVK